MRNWIFTLIFSLSSIPYILITYFSAEHLMYFFVILTIYAMVSYHHTKENFYLYLASAASVLCWFTKWEGQLVYFSVILFILLNLFFLRKRKKILIHFITILIFTFTFIFSYTFSRSVITKDFSTILNISNASMYTSMWRFYSSLPSTIPIYEKAFNLTD